MRLLATNKEREPRRRGERRRVVFLGVVAERE
jgi:hypothetical protein